MIFSTVSTLATLIAFQTPVNRIYLTGLLALMLIDTLILLRPGQIHHPEVFVGCTYASLAWAIVDQFPLIVQKFRQIQLLATKPSPFDLTLDFFSSRECDSNENSDSMDFDSDDSESLSDSSFSDEGYSISTDEASFTREEFAYEDIDECIYYHDMTISDVLERYTPEEGQERQSLRRYIEKHCIPDFQGYLMHIGAPHREVERSSKKVQR